MGRPSLERANVSTVVTIRVLPRAHRDQICGVVDGIIRMRVLAPPVEGKANARCIALLSKTLGIPSSSFEIIRGERSRVKVLRIQGISEQDVLQGCSSSLAMD